MLDIVEDRDRIELSGGSGMGTQGARAMRKGHPTVGQDGEDSALGRTPLQEVPGFGRCGRRRPRPVP